MAKTPRHTSEKILVVGDVALDWLEQSIPRTEETTLNYERYNPGFHLTPVWGGAALLHRLVESAVTARDKGYRTARKKHTTKYSVEKLKLPEATEPAARKYLQSLALIKASAPDDKNPKKEKNKAPVRVGSFKGFSFNPEATTPAKRTAKGRVSKPAVMNAKLPARVGKIACLVIDDAANGCRDDRDFRKDVERCIEKASLIIVKLSRPLESKQLFDSLLRYEPKRVVVVINVNDLRAEGVDISRRLSWERTALDVISAANDTSVLGRLVQVGDLMVRLGSDGCLVLTRDKKYVVFDPHGAEDAFDHELKGTMPGATSAFVASIAARLLHESKDVATVDVARFGLAASRRMLKTGFISSGNANPDRTGPLQKPDYPREIFFEDDDGAAVFRTEELPYTNEPNNWSILLARLNKSTSANEPWKLLEDVVRFGPDKTFENIPVSRYGKLLLVDRHEIEGYQSIENLIREYISITDIATPKPISIGVFGPPGSGKSFGIKQIAEHIDAKRIKPHALNLTQLHSPDDLVGAFHIARDHTLRGCIPLLIFDEFDCTFNAERWGWLKYFLAPMQDGEFKDEELLHPLGPAIFVFAGGTTDSYTVFNENCTGAEKDHFKAAKGPDFISRLKGYVDVQGISKAKNEQGEYDWMCIARRAVLLRSFLEQDKRAEKLFRGIDKDKEFQIGKSLLRALLEVDEYKHGARSLESILLMSRLMEGDRFAVASLPSNEQLMLHVDDSFARILKKYSIERTTAAAP